MAVTFNIQFTISVATKVIRLTDTSTGFTYGKGCFKVEFPNGVVRNLPDFSTPDISAAGNSINIPCELDASGNVITGSYIISYAVINNLSAGQTPLVRPFDFNWVEPTNGITNFSDVITPEVVFKDLTSYSPIGSFTGALTRTISSSFPSTSEVSAQAPITSTSTNTITVVSGANYYEGVYTPTSNVSVAYTHTSNAWLTILYTRTFSKTFAIKKCPNQLELVQKINAYRVIIDAYKETNDTQFNILSEQYDLVIALYSHLIAMHQTTTQDGSEPILRELLSILEPYTGTYTYQSTKMLPFELTSSGTNSFNISDGTNVDAVQLGSTLTFSSGNASLVPIVTNNVVTYSPTFGTLINTFAQGNDARFHNPVTIGTANGLSISTQALSLAAATTGSAGSMSASDKTKLDGIAAEATANTGTVTSVALTVPAAFTVTGSPITTAGTLAITAAGTSAQYITGSGALATLNTLNVPENTNLYYTNARSRTSISLTTAGTTGAATYDNTTGVLNIPSYIGGVTSFNTRNGAIVLSSADITTALTYTPVPNNRSLTINGVSFDLSADRSWSVSSANLNWIYYDNEASLPVASSNHGMFAHVHATGAAYYAHAGSWYKLAKQTDLDLKAPLASPTFTGTVSGITKSMVGLGNVDNTTDLLKPISTATQSALNLKYDASNPAGYTTNVGTVTSVGGTGTVSGLSLSGSVTTSGNLTLGGTLLLTSGNVTTALGYTPANATSISGTTNTIPKFTSSSAIGNSNITDTGSLVTITNPLTLSGSVTGTGNLSNYSVTASAGSAISKKITSTLIASANSDVLVGLDINPTFTNGAFTGVGNLGLRIGGTNGLRYDNPNARLTIGSLAQSAQGSVHTSGQGIFEGGLAFQYDAGVSAYVPNFTYSTSDGGYLNIQSWNSKPIYINNLGNNVYIGGIQGANVTIGANLSAGYRLDVAGTTRFQGTTSSDTAPLGSELAAVTGTGTNWALAGTNLNVGGYSHTTGDVTPLTTTLAAVNGTYYQITYTITGRTTGSITIDYGGTSTAGITATGNTGPLASSTAVLTITPTTDFNGTVVLSIKSIGTSLASSTFANSSGTSNIEVRASSIVTNTFIGIRAGRRNTTGFENTGVGVQALENNTSGIRNSAFGTYTLISNTTGLSNSAFGNFVLVANTTGSSNSAFGQNSGISNTTGSFNTFIGASAGVNNTTGFNNTEIGNRALFYQSTGSNNVAIGSFAGRSAASVNNTISDNSIFIGYDTRPNNISQTNQIVIGYQSTGLGSNTTVLGNSSTVTTAIYGSLVLGSTTDAGYRLDVTGTARVSGAATFLSSVTALSLDVISSSGAGSSTASGLARFITAGTTAGVSIGQSNSGRRLDLLSYGLSVTGTDMYITNTGANATIFENNGAERMRITSGGSMLMAKDAAIGINTSDGADNGYLALCGASENGENRGGYIYLSGNERVSDPGMAVIGAGNVIGIGSVIAFRTGAGVERMRLIGNGRLLIGTSADQGYLLFVNGNAAGTSGFANVSDIRLKKDITPIKNGLDKINRLNGVSFNWDKTSRPDLALDDKNHLGLIAQDVEEILPQVVTTGIDELKTKTITYSDIVPVLIEAIKELSAENTSLINRIEALENK